MIIDKQKLLEFLSNINTNTSLVSYSQEISSQKYFEVIRRLLRTRTDSVYLNRPSQNFSYLAVGEIFSITQQQINDPVLNLDLLNDLKINYFNNLNKQNFNKAPLFVGAQKFPLKEKTGVWSDFQYRKWFIPKFMFLRNNGNYCFIVNFFPQKTNIDNFCNEFEFLINLKDDIISSKYLSTKIYRNDIDDFTEWSKIILTGLEKISKKELDKVVHARCVDYKLESDINIDEIMTMLELNYPECYIFAYRSEGSIFFGATPEKLFSIEKGNIETDALAGSIQRGASPLADEELGFQLLESEKDIIEHNSVRNFLLEKLYHVTEDIIYSPVPLLRKLPNIQHLWTPITAKLKDNAEIFSLINNIFPTPAICGYPTDTALKLIYSMENFDRGLYAGIIGWFNFENQGDFAVALRSALLKDKTMFAFAGCGIVKGSDPLLEHNETELKLKPILSLFINETVNQS